MTRLRFCPDAVEILGAAGEWEAAGFLTWLMLKSPRTCLVKPGGGSQLSQMVPRPHPRGAPRGTLGGSQRALGGGSAAAGHIGAARSHLARPEGQRGRCPGIQAAARSIQVTPIHFQIKDRLIPRSADNDPFDGARRPAGQARAIKWVIISAPWYKTPIEDVTTPTGRSTDYPGAPPWLRLGHSYIGKTSYRR